MFDIKYDIEMDLNNYDSSYINRKYPNYGRGDFDTAPSLWPEIKDKIANASPDKKLSVAKKYLENTYKDSDIMKNSISILKKSWLTIEPIYLERLSSYMGLKSRPKKIDVYMTTLDICPYNTKYNYFLYIIF